MKVSLLIPLWVCGALAASCSTTRILAEGEALLMKNNVTAEGDEKFHASELNSYIEQKPGISLRGFNPLVSLYNWGGRDRGKFFKRMGQAPVIYDSLLVESSKENMRKHLEYIGYYGSEVSSATRIRSKKAEVDYYVRLGRRYPIGEVRYDVPERGEFAGDFFRDTARVSIRSGMHLSEALLEKESIRSAGVMKNLGYYDFSKNHYFFEADTLSEPGTALLTMAVREYTRNETEKEGRPIRKFYFNEVKISREESLPFRENVLTGFNAVRPGDLYRDILVNNTYSRLASLPVFSSVNMELTKVDTNLVDCHIRLTHSQIQGFKVNLEASVNSTGLVGISPQINYFHKNIFHGGERLTLGFLGNFQFMPNRSSTRAVELGASASLSIPGLLGISKRNLRGAAIPRTDIAVSYGYQDRTEYTRNVFSLAYGYSGNVRSRLFYQFYPLQVSFVRMGNMGERFRENIGRDRYLSDVYSSHVDVGFGATLYRTTNNDAVPKTSYRYLRLQTDLSGNVVSLFNRSLPTDSDGRHTLLGSPYTQYARIEVQAGRTYVFGKNDNHAIALRLLGGIGYAYGNWDVLPFEKQFYGGGANSLRGWQTRNVGPGTAPKNESFTIASQTGETKIEANAEYRFPMFWKLQGALFADAGNVWNLTSDNREEKLSWSGLPRSIALNWGLGARIDFTFILVRVDLGIQLHDPSRTGEPYFIPVSQWISGKHYALHFGVGYPF